MTNFSKILAWNSRKVAAFQCQVDFRVWSGAKMTYFSSFFSIKLEQLGSDFAHFIVQVIF